jgi:ABC-2 type transport system permease protein
MFGRLRHMLVKECLQVFRDPRMRAIIFFVPVFQTLIFGYIVTTDVKRVTTAVCDLDDSAASRELINRFVAPGYFRIAAHVPDLRAAQELVDRGRAQAVLHVGPGFERELRAGRPAPVQVLLDGTDSNTAAVVLQYALRITRQLGGEIQAEQSARRRGAVAPGPRVELEARPWFNPTLESRNYHVPAVIALMVSIVTLLLTSMAVVREKEIGTLEQVLVTPIRPSEFILGKTIPFALIAFADMALVTLVGVFWFDVPFRGSVGLLCAATGLYLLTTLGVGLFISTISQTQQQAMMSTFFFFFPAMLLSGFVFPIANMPEPVQWLTYVNPVRYFLVLLRSIFLKGVGVEILWPHMAALAVMGLLMLGLAAKRLRKTLA